MARVDLRDYVPVLDGSGRCHGYLAKSRLDSHWERQGVIVLRGHDRVAVSVDLSALASPSVDLYVVHFTVMLMQSRRDERRWRCPVLTVVDHHLLEKIQGFVSFAQAHGEEI